MYTYFILHLITIIFPLSYSFESKISYYKKWKELFTAIFIVATFFLIWDYFFTKWNVWHFNKKYVVGWELLGLPIEEWLFFITVPFSCVFIYEALNYFIKKDLFQNVYKGLTLAIILGLLSIAFLNTERIYTFTTFLLTACLLSVHLFYFKSTFLSRFYLTYLVHLIPFFLVNGILTYLPVVIYNNEENLGIRIGTIPVEDSIYSMLLLLMNIGIYEYLKKNSVIRILKGIKYA